MKLSDEVKEYIKKFEYDLKKNNLDNIFGVSFGKLRDNFRQELLDTFIDSGIDIFEYLTKVEYDAFKYLKSLPEVLSLPKVRTIGALAFCSTLIKKVDCPNCEFIDTAAFMDCGNITSINIPNVDKIEERAFYHSSIEELSLPIVTSLHNIHGAFEGCHFLKKLYLPNLTDSHMEYDEIDKNLMYMFNHFYNHDKTYPILQELYLPLKKYEVALSSSSDLKDVMKKSFSNLKIINSTTGDILLDVKKL